MNGPIKQKKIMDVSASLFSWIQLTRCVTDSGFKDVQDCFEFVKAFYALFPESEKNTTDDIHQNYAQNESEELKQFLYSVLKSLPEGYKANVPLIDVTSFVNCEPDFLEEITKAFLFSMNLWKRDELMDQLNQLQESERNDLFGLLNPQQEDSETNELMELAEQLRNYSRQLEISIKYDDRIKELKYELSQSNKNTNKTKEMAKQKQLQVLQEHKDEIRERQQENESIEGEISTLEEKIQNIENELNEKGDSTMKLGELARENINLKSSHSFYATSIELIKSSPLFLSCSDIEEEMSSKKDMIETLNIQKQNIQDMIETTNNMINEYYQLDNEIHMNEKKIQQNMQIIKEEKENGSIAKLLEELKEERREKDLLLETPKKQKPSTNYIIYFFIIFTLILTVFMVKRYVL